MLTKSLLIWMVHFASAYSGYSVPAGLPEVTFVRGPELIQHCDTDAAAACTDAYGELGGHIWMPVRCAPMASVECRGYLVHEITHWLQYKHGQFKGQDCFGPLEKEAYHVEDKYYGLKGENLSDYGIPKWYLIQLTSCVAPYESSTAP